MGGLRTDVERLIKLLPDPKGIADGYVVTTTHFVDENGVTQYRYVLTPGGGGGNNGKIILPIQSDTQSTQYGLATKLTLGRIYFDPSDFSLQPTSVATFYMLIEITNSSNTADGELYQETGSGSPQIIGSLTATNSTTAVLLSADVSSAFNSSSPAGIFAARCWVGSENGNDEATSSAAWVEITP